MSDLIFIKDYKKDDKLRKSFNKLAIATFGQGIDFEPWYQAGYWNDKYICYSYISNSEVIANVSVNELTIVVTGVPKQVLQIGTVMTHSDYRRQGLSMKLFDKVFEDYEGKVEYIYLFGNDSAKPLYIKCGFEPSKETEFKSAADVFDNKTINKVKLDINKEKDLNLLKKLSIGRTPISNKFGITNDEHLIMFYCSKFMGHTLYYLEEFDAIVSYEIEDECLNLYEVITHKKIDLGSIIEGLIETSVESIVYHFTPDIDISLYSMKTLESEECTLLIKPMKKHVDFPFQYAMFSHA